jgi:lysophospholipase L1-like esterase
MYRAILLTFFWRAACSAELIPVTDPALYFSPYNTYSDGSGPMLSGNVRGGSTYAMWIFPGSYLRAAFTGSSAGLDFDISSIKHGIRPKLRWSIDNQPFQTAVLKPDATRLMLAEGLNEGSHHLVLYLAASDANYDRWRSPEEAIKLKGLVLNDGGKGEQDIRLSAKRALFFGDSITEGAWVLGRSNHVVAGKYVDWVAHSDATQAWPRLLAAALDAEYGTCGSGGMSWLRTSHSGIPPLPDSWSFHYENHSRLSDARKLSPSPDYVIVNMGTNDGEKDTTGAIEKWLNDIRAAVRPDTAIFVVVPFGQMNRTSLNGAVAAVADPHTRLIDLGVRRAAGLNHYGEPTLVSLDGLHPSAEASGIYAASLAAALSRLLHD